jgi:hypothetical protein
MREVSDAWKEAHNRVILPETFVEISLSVMDTTVTGSVSCDEESAFSKKSKILNQQNITVSKTYAFLEHNLWTLDGSKSILPDDTSYSPPGYVSDNDGNVVLTVNVTSATTTIPGFTITWSSEYDTYATEFIVDVKKDGVVVGTATVTNNSSNVSAVDLPVSDYDSVIITVLGWSLPEQRRRIDSILFGQKLVFGKNEIMSYSHEKSGDPLGAELTQNIIEFSVDNSDDRWNILNPTGMGRYLFNRQPLEVRYGLDVDGTVEWIYAGTFYLTEWKAPPDGVVATFVARDFMEFLLNETYSRGYLAAKTSGSTRVYSTSDAVQSADFPSDGTEKLTLESGTVVNVYERSTNPNVFGVFGYDGDSLVVSQLRVYRIKEGWVDSSNITITDNMLYTDIREAMRKSALKTLTWSYATGLKNGTRPIAIEETNAAEFIQSCLFSCGYTLWEQSDGRILLHSPLANQYTTLSDYTIPLEWSYVHPYVELAKPLKKFGITYRKRFDLGTGTAWYTVNDEGDSLLIDCPFAWDNSALSSMVQKYKDWWGVREIVSGEFRADPRLDLFDVVTVETKYGNISPIMITYLKYTYNGSFKATYEGKALNAVATTELED